METRKLGSAGPAVSAIGLGCNNFGNIIDQETAKRVAYRALDLGITLFDTADVYADWNSETYLGNILGARRKEVLLATKFGMGAGVPKPEFRSASRQYVMQAVEASLKCLKTDYIDLYQLHHPDPQTPLEETLRAMDDLVKAGKVRFIGLSNHEGWQAADAAWISKVEGIAPIVSMQNEYNLLARQAELSVIPAMQKYGMGLLPWSPLATGFLTGKYKRNQPSPENFRLGAARMKTFAARTLTDRNWDLLTRYEAFAASRDMTMLELAYAWLQSRTVVSSVISGARNPEQVAANVKAAERRLSKTDILELDAIGSPFDPTMPTLPKIELR